MFTGKTAINKTSNPKACFHYLRSFDDLEGFTGVKDKRNHKKHIVDLSFLPEIA